MNDVPDGSRFRFPGISPLELGLGISGVLLVALLAWETAHGQWPEIMEAAQGGALARQSEGILRDFRIAVVHVLLVGYLPAAFLAVIRGGKRTVFELQEALDCTREECSALAASIRLNPLGLAAAALIGLALGILSPYIVPPVPLTPWNPQTWPPEVAWHRILGPFAAAWAALLVYAVVSVSRRMSRLAVELSSVDLFDLRPLQPFSQQGLTNALLVMGYVSITGLMMLTETGFGLMALILGPTALLVAGAALMLPLRGVHSRIVQAKAEELRWVDDGIQGQRTAMRATDESPTPGMLADLAAYRDLVREIPDWPISSSSYARFALYLLLPVFSWAAAALVERLVSAVVF